MVKNLVIFGSITGLSLFSYFIGYQHLHTANNVAASIVAVLTIDGSSGGTGFVTEDLKGGNIIVTNDHVCAVQVGGYVVVQDDKLTKYVKRILVRSFVYDLCIIEGIEAPALSVTATPPTRFQELRVMGHPLLQPSTPAKGVYIGDGLFPVGFQTDDECPSNSVPNISFFGIICVLHMHLSLTNIEIYPGNSGSPVIDNDGNVTGVINSANPVNNHGNFVPSAYLLQLIKENL
jgi:S1-C subfamily serine protease